MKALTSFTFLIYKITANCDCNNEMERSLLLRRKAKTHLDSILRRSVTNLDLVWEQEPVTPGADRALVT